ncbi:hypothetical protein PBAL39_17814 [Pedobacter sp. BAL39]|uniref:hypothetical protein n=1 Tax=Pedobacter sp. BAL39 TaxID=391596 RepID=UPI0001559CF3|nr:hypothetical protein [Pedobacter sp. BAL39]EDM36755.1 hypothetical protein PBAL39_17814 [Pedobacter sp. BAL39]
MIYKLILSACLLTSAGAYAQNLKAKNVPSIVINSMNKAFPKAEKVEWEMENGLFNAEFEINRREHELWINNRGAIVKHKQDLRTDQLPEVVRNGAKKYFAGYRVDEVEKIELAQRFYYKLCLKTFTDEEHAVFDQEGKRVNKRI